jgi:hypothetical protein
MKRWISKKKGNFYELLSSKFWSKELGIKVLRTPRSGAFFSMPADLLVFGNSILKDFCIDVKSEQGLLPKKVVAYFKKNKEDAEGKIPILEIYVNYYEDSPLILISRKEFAKILSELDNYRKEKDV